MCLGASYATPVVVLMIKNLGGGKGVGGERSGVEGAQFSLGRWGVWINFVAVAWIGLAMVLFSMPAVLPVKSMSMSGCLFLLLLKGRRTLLNESYCAFSLSFRLCLCRIRGLWCV